VLLFVCNTADKPILATALFSCQGADVASTMSDNLSLIITCRQGETAGADALTFTPSDQGIRLH
jgi:hypothetical protein